MKADRSTAWQRARTVVATFDGCMGYVEETGRVLIGQCRHQEKPNWGRLGDARCPDCPFARFTLVPVVPTEAVHTSSNIGHG